jgi:hypothetical protein
MSDENVENVEEPTEYEYVLMITMLRVYDALGALLEEIRPGAGKQLFDIHSEGKLVMPEPRLLGEFGAGFE